MSEKTSSANGMGNSAVSGQDKFPIPFSAATHAKDENLS